MGDINRAYYRSKEEEQDWRENHDPLKLLADKLLSSKLADQELLDKIYADVKSEVETGVQFAIDAPYPDASQVTEDVYA